MSKTTSISTCFKKNGDVIRSIRGIAILGILPMNALTWGFNDFAGYSNVRAVGTEQPFDWSSNRIKLFIEQKMMAVILSLRRRGRYFLGTGWLENSAPQLVKPVAICPAVRHRNHSCSNLVGRRADRIRNIGADRAVSSSAITKVLMAVELDLSSLVPSAQR